MSTQLTKNFTLEELTYTSHKVDNTPSAEIKQHLQETAEMIQSVRDTYGKPIRISSGYRSQALNKIVKGSNTSAHTRGYAVDTTPIPDNLKTMTEYQHIVLDWAKTHDFDQIIIEYPKAYIADWIHIGLKNSENKQRKQIIYTLDGKHYYPINKNYYV